VARDRGEVVGVAPLMLSQYSFLRLGKLRKIELVGSPQSDYNNFILVRREMECVRLFLNHLLGECSDWDYLELRDIRENSLSAALLCKMCNVGNPLKLEQVVATLCPYINLPGSIEAFMGGLSRNMRRNLRKRMQRLRRDHRVEVKTYRDFGSVKEAMNAFFDLHQRRWGSKGEQGVFVRRMLRDFHLDVAERFAERSWLSLYFLTVDGEPAASIYSFDYGQKKYGYLTGFDPEYQSYGVGSLLRLCVIEECIRRGLREYDLTRGYEPYKADWSPRLRRNFDVRLVRRGWFGRVYGWSTKNNALLLLTQKLGASLTLGR